jgi:hypothetical protein
MGILSNEVSFVFVGVHSLHVLLEIVETRPNFVLVTAAARSALIRSVLDADAMDAFFMSVQIVHGCESLVSSFALGDVTLERFFVLEHMLFMVGTTLGRFGTTITLNFLSVACLGILTVL